MADSRVASSPCGELGESGSPSWFPVSPSRTQERGSLRGIFSESSSVAKGSDREGEDDSDPSSSHGLRRLDTALDEGGGPAAAAFRPPSLRQPTQAPARIVKETLTVTTGPKLGRHQSERYLRPSQRENHQLADDSPRAMSEPAENESDDGDVIDELPHAFPSFQPTKGSAVAHAPEVERGATPVMSIEDFMNRYATSEPTHPRSPVRQSLSGGPTRRPASMSPNFRSPTEAISSSRPGQGGTALWGDAVADDGSETHLMYLPSSLRQSVLRSPPSALRAQACRKLALYTAPLEEEAVRVVVLSPRKSSSSSRSGTSSKTQASGSQRDGDPPQDDRNAVDGTERHPAGATGDAPSRAAVKRLVRSKGSAKRSRSRPMSESKRSRPILRSAGGKQRRAVTSGHPSTQPESDWIDVIAQRGRTMRP